MNIGLILLMLIGGSVGVFFYTLHSDQPSCHNFSEDLSKNSIRSFSL
mgnify:FL=1